MAITDTIQAKEFEAGAPNIILKGDLRPNQMMASEPDRTDTRNELALELFGKDLRLLQLPKGQDPDDFIMNNGVKAFLDLQSMLPEEWEIMNEHVLTKRLLADYWLPKIANMNSLHHSTLLTTLSNKSGIDLSSLRQNLNLLILDKISSLVANVALEDKVTLKIERSSI